MTPTDWAAWIGAITGVCAIAWDFIKWKTAGPKLKVWTHRNMVLMPDPVSSKNRYIEVRIRNNGTAKTTITTCGFHLYDSWFAQMRRKPSKSMIIANPIGAQPLPYQDAEKLAVIDQFMQKKMPP